MPLNLGLRSNDNASASYGASEDSSGDSSDYSRGLTGDGNREKSPLVKRSGSGVESFSPPNEPSSGGGGGGGAKGMYNTLEGMQLSEGEKNGIERQMSMSDEAALTGDVAEQINYLSVNHIGLFLQYFCVGICYSCSISVNYEFFTSYMGQSGDFFNVAKSAIALPWSFKIIYGAVNDCLPLKGYRRKPYMVIGWVGCAIVGLALAVQPLPGSRFVHDQEAIDSGNCSAHGIIKPNSEEEYQRESLKFMMMLALFNVFLVLTDVAMDGLMVQYARKESLKRRGRAQTMIYVTRSIGMACGAVMKGFGLNWYEYSGPWCRGLDISDIFIMLTVTSCLAIPATLFMTTEDKVSEAKSVEHVVGKMWALLQNTAVQQVLVFQMGTAILMAVSSPADSMIQLHWVGVDNLTKNILVGVLGQLTFSLGSAIFAKYLIDFSWKKIYGATALIMVVMNASLTYIVIYDVIRNQYFYLSDELTQEFFVGVNYICGLVLFIELSESDTEGISYALMTTTTNASMTLGVLLGNFVVYFFHVSEHEKYLRDSARDRNIVAANYAVIYLVNLGIIFLLPLLPRGKRETQDLKGKAKTSKPGGIALIVSVSFFMTFSVLYSFVFYRFFE